MNISPLAQASLRQPFCDVGTHLPFLFFTYFLPFLACSQKQPDTVCIVQIGGPLSKSLHASWQEVPCCFHSWRLGHLGVAGHLKIGISHPSSEVPVTSGCCPSLHIGGSFIVQSVGGHLKIGVSQPSSEVFFASDVWPLPILAHGWHHFWTILALLPIKSITLIIIFVLPFDRRGGTIKTHWWLTHCAKCGRTLEDWSFTTIVRGFFASDVWLLPILAHGWHHFWTILALLPIINLTAIIICVLPFDSRGGTIETQWLVIHWARIWCWTTNLFIFTTPSRLLW